jgi:uncharacterized protein YcbK (DUF882 family)
MKENSVMSLHEMKLKYPEKLAPNFYLWEIACKCCGQAMFDLVLLSRLQELRNHFNRPINVNSFYRCPDYNETLPGASKNSYHLYGMAADIVCPGIAPATLGAAAKALGLYTLLYKTFLHVDTRGYYE